MATRTQSTVVAVFRNRSEAEAAASDLKANGFSSNNIFVSSDTSAVDATQQPGGVYSDAQAHSHEHEGGIVGWFKSVFGQEDTESDRPYYENAVSSGHTFLSVDVTDESIDRAASILSNHNPVDVHEEAGSGEVRSSGTAAQAPLAGASTAAATSGRSAGTTTGRTGEDTGAIPVVREELKVGKRAVLRGGVRVYSRVVEQPVQESVQLHEERVRVDRAPVNREASAADLRAGTEQVFEVKEYAEEPVVSKQARVVEEVRVHKDATERTETVRENVRHTEVNVENVGPGTTARTGGTTAAGTTTGAGVGTEAGARPAGSTLSQSAGATAGAAGTANDPGYNYGYEMANDPRYRGRRFEDVESDLRTDYGRRYPNSTWESTKDSIRRGWDKLTGR
jgi:uncharacterized protein (TIGR02271 family)